ncbi:DUF4424 family protein [Breoghania sp. L-A4]|uniref:DUF4424 family protein n=1 Tax=Breoghania sp. L-A4 TaxID=2304600 RepID=UPI000E35E6AB|nr:DUF4424 family protein [Breoghania sp. L-A4]AXS39639.1 DUF4424 domain-containing protein [Breoghania sp. L-A4]
MIDLRAASSAIIVAAGLVSVLPALANDSSASIVAGGVVLGTTDAVRIASEGLYVSAERIDVDYVFENITDRDVTVQMAFPLPDVDARNVYGTWPEQAESTRFINFATSIDGRPVVTREIVEIIGADGRPITDIFRREGFPLAPYSSAWGDDIETGTPEAEARMARLAELGLLSADGRPDWTTRISFVWEAIFPARRTVEVSHSYKPVAGSFFFTPEVDNFESWYRARYCASAGEWRSLNRVAGRKQEYRLISEVGYALKPGANWAGPIGRFHLTLDKGHPKNLITLCFKGDLKKTAPTRFEFEAFDYTPREDILFAIMNTTIGD